MNELPLEVKQYRKKPVVIEAVQLTTENQADVAIWCHGHINHSNGLVEIVTLEGTMTAQMDDFIIKGIKGEFYPCKPDIFWDTYEELDL